MVRFWSSASIILAAALSLVPIGAEACSLAQPSQPYQMNPEAWPDDVTPPDAVSAVSVDYFAGESANGCDGCGTLPGRLNLYIEPPEDDLAPAKDLGYRITVIEGGLPGASPPLDGFVGGTASQNQGTLLSIDWDDDGGSRRLDIVLRIEPVDPAGNVGAPLELPIEINAENGCSATRGIPSQFPLMAAGCLLFGLTRVGRRRRQPQ